MTARVRIARLALAAAVATAGVHAIVHDAHFAIVPDLHVAVAADAPSATRQLWTCGMHPQVIRDAPGLCPICHMELTPLAPDAGDAGAITIDPVVVQNMGVRTSEVRRGPLARTIRAVGYLDEAEPRVHDVNLRVSGWVERLHADTVGMHVAAGDPLFELYSPEVQVAVEELIAARRGAVGMTAGAMLTDVTRRKLERFGLAREQIDRLARLESAPRTVTITSPITGHVTEKAIVAGAAVKAGDRALEIVDHSLLWLDIQVYARDVPAVAVGQTVTATIEGVTDRRIEGQVIFVHPHVDPTTRTATVRTSVPNPAMTLRPGMYATARIAVAVADDAILIPREAVIDTGTRQLAFVAAEGGRFEPRTLTVGAAGDDGVVQVLAGVAPGERVVTSGQFLLDAESRMREAIQKYLREGLTSGAPAAPPPAAHQHP